MANVCIVWDQKYLSTDSTGSHTKRYLMISGINKKKRYVCHLPSCADPGGGPCQSDKKSSDNVFFFLVLSLLYRSQMVNFKEIYHFSTFQRGSNIFQRGSKFFQGGSNCLFPIETHITCDFPGGVRTPCPSLWIRTWPCIRILATSSKTFSYTCI